MLLKSQPKMVKIFYQEWFDVKVNLGMFWKKDRIL